MARFGENHENSQPFIVLSFSVKTGEILSAIPGNKDPNNSPRIQAIVLIFNRQKIE